MTCIWAVFVVVGGVRHGQSYSGDKYQAVDGLEEVFDAEMDHNESDLYLNSFCC